MSNIFKHLLGLGVRALASDSNTTPEQLADAAEAVRAATAADDTRGRAQDRRSKDSADDTHADDRRADDRHADDRRQRMHDALDRLLDGSGGAPPMAAEEPQGSEAAVDRRADDADLGELQNLLGQYFSEEQEEPEHSVEDEAEMEVSESGGEEVEEEEPEGAVDRARAADAARGAVMATLKGLRPFVARCKDSSVKNAFNTALQAASKGSKPSTGGYGHFAATARARDTGARQPNRNRGRAADSVVDQNTKLQQAYNEAFKGGK